MNAGEFKLKVQKFKGNKSISSERLASLIPPSQKPNATLLSTPFSPKVALYWFGKFFYSELETRDDITYYTDKLKANSQILSERKVNKYQKQLSKAEKNLATKTNVFMREFGEAPAVIDEVRIAKLADNIQAFYRAEGFRDAEVKYAISYNIGNTASVTYDITENKPYLISKVDVIAADSTISQLLKASQAASLIKKGDRYRNVILNDDYEFDELDRIDTLLKNNGYFEFERQPNFIKTMAQVDSSVKDTAFAIPVNLSFLISSGDTSRLLKKYYIKNISFEATNPNESGIRDSLFYKGIQYKFNGTSFPPKYLDRKITLAKGDLFKLKDVEETQSRISQLNQFGFLDISYKKASEDSINVAIKTSSLLKYGRTFELNANSVQRTVGGGFLSTLSVRNLWGRLESFDNTLRISSEGQPSALTADIRRSLELGFNTSLNFPSIIWPTSERKLRDFQNQRTQLRLGTNFSRLYEYRRTNFNFGLAYQYKPSLYENIEFNPLDINYLFTRNIPEFQAQLDNLTKQGSTFPLLFGRQFVSSFSGTYAYSTAIEGKNLKSNFVRFSAESSGTTLNFIKSRELPLIKTIGGDSVNFFQFLKFNIDYRHYLPLAPKKTLAYRANLGIANPYGKNKLLPYEKSFFVGGTNSLRAWAPRSLGPGSALPDTAIGTSAGTARGIIAQPGDILIEGSIEHRHYLGRFYADILGAGFLDVGNVWKWYQVANKKDQANFSFQRFLKEFAVSAGYGLRFDLEYFVFRWDVGLKIYDPSQAAGQKLVARELFTQNVVRPYPYRLINWSNIGIGFPF